MKHSPNRCTLDSYIGQQTYQSLLPCRYHNGWEFRIERNHAFADASRKACVAAVYLRGIGLYSE